MSPESSSSGWWGPENEGVPEYLAPYLTPSRGGEGGVTGSGDRRPELVLGVSLHDKDHPVGLTLKELESHVIIVGGTGFGKTLSAKKLCLEFVERGLRCIVIDVKGEYVNLPDATVLKPGKGLCLSPLLPEDAGITAADMLVLYAAGMLRYAVTRRLGHGAEVSLSHAMERELLSAVKRVVRRREPLYNVIYEVRRAKMGKATKNALLARLETLLIEPLGSVLRCHGRIELGGGGIIVYDLSEFWRFSHLHLAAVVTLILLMLRLEAATRTARGWRKLDTLVIIDEAPTVAPSGSPGENLLAELARTVRAGGVALAIISQSYLELRRDVRSSIGALITFGTANSEEARAVASSLGPGVKPEDVQSLGKHHFILGGSAVAGVYYGVLDVASVIAAEKREFLEEIKRRFLASVKTYPCLTVRQRRELLGVNGSYYRKAEKELVREGKITKLVLRMGRGRPAILYETNPPMRPSVLHRCAAEKIAGALRRRLEGAEVKLEYRGADIAVVRGEKLVAVEVETGSNIVRGKYLRLLQVEGFNHVVVVVIDRRHARRAKNAVEGLNATVMTAREALIRLPSLIEDLLS